MKKPRAADPSQRHTAPPAASRGGKNRLPAWLLGDWRLNIAVVVSLLLHGVALSVEFRFPGQDRPRNRDSSLEVVLVNARHAKAPDQAEVLAQAHLDGGGSTDESVRPTTPVPPQDARKDGDALADARRIQEPPKVEQPKPPVLTSEKSPRPAVKRSDNSPPPVAKPEPAPVTGLDLLDSAAAVAKLEAQIDRSLNEYAKRPRKQFIGARTREYRFARYVEDWRQKIERVGTLNYPDAARGRMYGSLLVSVVIRADGSLEKVEIQRSSGKPVLDEAALNIVRLAAPFAAFPPDIRADTDIIEITRTWTFTNSDKLTAQ